MTLTSNASQTTAPNRGAAHAVLAACATAAIYWGSARLALCMAIPPGYATAVWPSAGLGLICVLVWGPRATAGIAVASCLVNLGTSFDASSAVAIVRSFAIAAAIGGGAGLQAAIGARLIRRRVGFPSALCDERDIVRFIALGGPVACLTSATVGVAVLAIAGVLPPSSLAFHWWTWWVGDTIGVLVFAPLALLALPRSHPVWRRRRGIIGVPLVLGFLAVTALFLRASAWERARLRTDFERSVVPVAAVLRSHLSSYEEVVTSLVGLFDASQRVDRGEFRAFCARPLAKHPGLVALSWNPRVPAAQRGELEAGARADGLDDFVFTEQTEAGEIRRAGSRAEYVPVYFVEPRHSNEAVLGYDTASDPDRRDVLERARRLGALAASYRVRLVQNVDGVSAPAGVLLVAPVFTRPRGDELRGYAVGAFALRDVVEAALVGIDHSGLIVTIVDSAEAGDAVLYTTQGERAAADSDHRLGFALAFGDRRWRLEVAPTAALVASQRSWQAWTVLAGGLLFVGLLGIVLLITTGRTFQWYEGAERFRALTEASAQMVWTTTAGGEAIEDSPSWRAFTGQSLDQWRGLGWLDVIHADDRDAVRRYWRDVIASGAGSDTEYRVRHAGGDWRWIAARAVPLVGGHGELTGWVISNTDVTERKRAADQFRVAIDAAPTGMLMIDGRGRIALVNAQIEKVFGYARDELIGSPIELLIPGRFRDQHPGHRAKFGDQPSTRAMGAGRDLYGLRKDGSEVPVEIGLNPLRAADQDYILSSVVDITERKRAEAERERLLDELRTLNTELERRVQSRTSELTASLREREVLLQEVHHRVKNNLQVISSLINMQVRKLEDRSSRDALEECQTRVQAIALIHEKLYQSRDYARVPFSEYTRTLVQNVFHTMGVSLGSVELDMAIEDVAVPVDKAIPCGLLLNELISNALKHAFVDGRPGELRVELGRRGDRLRLAVSDNGVGLPAGLDIRGTRSFGLQLVTTLVEQLDATLVVGDRGGARFELDFAMEN